MVGGFVGRYQAGFSESGRIEKDPLT